MADRFDRLDRFLPPAGDGSDMPLVGEPGPAERNRRARRALAGLRGAGRFIGIALVAALLIGAAALAASVSSDPAPMTATGSSEGAVDVSLGAGPTRPVPAGAGVTSRNERRPQRVRREARRRKLRPRRVRRPIVVAGAARNAPPEPVAEPAPQPQERRRSRTGQKPAKERPEPEPVPAAPQTSLYHCATIQQSEHFMTIDPGRAEQLSKPRSGWTCEVVGRVYAERGADRAPVELDDGRAYVLKRKVDTEPATQLEPLYRHWAGYDWWYSTRQADGGFTGYIAV